MSERPAWTLLSTHGHVLLAVARDPPPQALLARRRHQHAEGDAAVVLRGGGADALEDHQVAGLDHVGLGGDFDGTTATPVGLDDVSRYPALLDALRDRGWTEDDLVALAHGNVVRVLREAGEA